MPPSGRFLRWTQIAFRQLRFVTCSREHLRHAHRAIQDGIKLRGYMQWSLMDNLEWAAGYRIRCGLIHVDFKTQERTLKDSARWYQQVIARNSVF